MRRSFHSLVRRGVSGDPQCLLLSHITLLLFSRTTAGSGVTLAVMCLCLMYLLALAPLLNSEVSKHCCHDLSYGLVLVRPCRCPYPRISPRECEQLPTVSSPGRFLTKVTSEQYNFPFGPA